LIVDLTSKDLRFRIWTINNTRESQKRFEQCEAGKKNYRVTMQNLARQDKLLIQALLPSDDSIFWPFRVGCKVGGDLQGRFARLTILRNHIQVWPQMPRVTAINAIRGDGR
jgi:hypothetical protein